MTKIDHVWVYIIHYVCILQFGSTFRSEKPVAEKIWKQPCTKSSRILNDCNWCSCSEQKRFTCSARVCSEVDMFGHFNDAIKEIDVGMEGRGVWRTNPTACQPGVHYQRGQLLCICNEDGNWPNPVCRDTFRVLYDVEVAQDIKTFKDDQCTPSKLYLIGCNVCFCPEDGIPNPKYCTRKSCTKDDPVFAQPKENTAVDDIYASCNVDKTYKIGCQHCKCLRNNRLVCDNCTEQATHCSGREPGEAFNIDCNLCHCDADGLLYCSVKRCLNGVVKTPDSIDESKYESVDRPQNYLDCVRGTTFKVGCRTCFCYKFADYSVPICDMELCSDGARRDEPRSDCVLNTLYEMDCMICQCAVFNGKKMEMCRENPNCKKGDVGRSLQELSELRGYCEPLHLYKKDCNTCECLADGKTVRCTSNVCGKNKPLPLSIDIVPVVKDVGKCPKGRSFKIDCNACFCLSNGDVLCTTSKCSKTDQTRPN